MPPIQVAQIAILALTAASGIMGFFVPPSWLRFTGLRYEDKRGLTELRVTFGGFALGMGLAPILLNTPEAYHVAGYTYLSIAVSRAIAILYDKSFTRSNGISLIAEIAFGIILAL